MGENQGIILKLETRRTTWVESITEKYGSGLGPLMEDDFKFLISCKDQSVTIIWGRGTFYPPFVPPL
jgi:hypothetical protein